MKTETKLEGTSCENCFGNVPTATFLLDEEINSTLTSVRWVWSWRQKTISFAYPLHLKQGWTAGPVHSEAEKFAYFTLKSHSVTCCIVFVYSYKNRNAIVKLVLLGGYVQPICLDDDANHWMTQRGCNMLISELWSCWHRARLAFSPASRLFAKLSLSFPGSCAIAKGTLWRFSSIYGELCLWAGLPLHTCGSVLVRNQTVQLMLITHRRERDINLSGFSKVLNHSSTDPDTLFIAVIFPEAFIF